MTEDRSQKTEDRGQKTEDRSQKTDFGMRNSEFGKEKKLERGMRSPAPKEGGKESKV